MVYIGFICNRLKLQIGSASLAQMDQNLIEEEIKMKQVYEELRKSISTKYFSLDEVNYGHLHCA